MSSEAKDCCRFTDARRSCDDNIGHVSIACKDCKTRYGVFVSNDFLEIIIFVASFFSLNFFWSR